MILMFIIIIKILLFINNNDHHCDNNNNNKNTCKTKNKLRPQYLLLAAVVAGEAFVVVLPIAPYHCMSHWQHMQQVLTLLLIVGIIHFIVLHQLHWLIHYYSTAVGP